MPVIQSYRTHGYKFIEDICNDITGEVLETLSGISALTAGIDMNSVDAFDFDFDCEDEDV